VIGAQRLGVFQEGGLHVGGHHLPGESGQHGQVEARSGADLQGALGWGGSRRPPQCLDDPIAAAGVQPAPGGVARGVERVLELDQLRSAGGGAQLQAFAETGWVSRNTVTPPWADTGTAPRAPRVQTASGTGPPASIRHGSRRGVVTT